MLHALQRPLQRITDLLLPPTCVLCHAPARSGICANCRQDLPRPGPVCPRCAEPLPVAAPTAESCPHCARHPPELDRLWAPFTYAWPVNQLILAFKAGQSQLGPALGGLLAAHLAEQSSSEPQPATVSGVIPVPLHPGRYAARGYNQAEILARSICRQHQLPLLTKTVTRNRATPSQQSLGRQARRRNLAGAFTVNADVQGQRLVIVDDVATTGTTLNTIARELRAAGAVWIGALTLARA